MKAEASITEMCVPHLLLHENLLYRNTRVVNGSNLARDWPPLLVTSSKGPNTGSPIVNIIFFPYPCACAADLSLVCRKFLSSLVPHKAGEGVTLYELSCVCGLRLVGVQHVTTTEATRRAPRELLKYFYLAGNGRPRHACTLCIP